MVDLTISAEWPSDRQAIYEVTRLAFMDRDYADGDEPDVVNRLRSAGALALSLVACIRKRIVGQVSFSPASQSDDSAPWYALRPISVHRDYQSQGIGCEPIPHGLGRLRALDDRSCILVGNPAYYQRFGFALAPEHTPLKESSDYFQLTLFASGQPKGVFTFRQAF